jgi:hypothetical protein
VVIIVSMRRLIDEGSVTHAVHNGIINTVVLQITACGIRFVEYDLPNESAESSLHRTFRTIDPPGKIKLLRGTLEDLAVDCISCLVGMRTWNQT